MVSLPLNTPGRLALSEVDDLDGVAPGSLDRLIDHLAAPAQRDALVLGIPYPIERPPVVAQETLDSIGRHGFSNDIAAVSSLVRVNVSYRFEASEACRSSLGFPFAYLVKRRENELSCTVYG